MRYKIRPESEARRRSVSPSSRNIARVTATRPRHFSWPDQDLNKFYPYFFSEVLFRREGTKKEDGGNFIRRHSQCKYEILRILLKRDINFIEAVRQNLYELEI